MSQKAETLLYVQAESASSASGCWKALTFIISLACFRRSIASKEKAFFVLSPFNIAHLNTKICGVLRRKARSQAAAIMKRDFRPAKTCQILSDQIDEFALMGLPLSLTWFVRGWQMAWNLSTVVITRT